MSIIQVVSSQTRHVGEFMFLDKMTETASKMMKYKKTHNIYSLKKYSKVKYSLSLFSLIFRIFYRPSCYCVHRLNVTLASYNKCEALLSLLFLTE